MSTSRFSAKAHQRDRQSLFTAEQITRSQSASPLLRNDFNYNESITSTLDSNPYEKSRLPKYFTKAAEMALLESQSEDTVNEMKYKIGALKDLSLAMGDQINKSKDTIVELGEDMGISSEKIKQNMNRMKHFVEKSGVGWKVWAGFTVVVMWWFIWVWLF